VISQEVSYDYTPEAEEQRGKYVFDRARNLYVPDVSLAAAGAEGSGIGAVRTLPTHVASGDELRLPWLWVEGWRAELRRAGDGVEKARWLWRVEEAMSASEQRAGRTRRKKSVHWA